MMRNVVKSQARAQGGRGAARAAVALSTVARAGLHTTTRGPTALKAAKAVQGQQLNGEPSHRPSLIFGC